MDILLTLKNTVKVGAIANSALNAGSEAMLDMLENIMDVNAEFIKNTTIHLKGLPKQNEKGHVIICNHPSFFDFALIKKCIDCYCVTNSVDKTIHTTEEYLKKYKVIPYYDEGPNSGKNVQKLILQLINQGHNVLVFPQGEIQTEGKMGKLKKGLFHLCFDNKIDILVFTILIKCSIESNYLRSILAYLQIPIESPQINVFYNSCIHSTEHNSFESLYDECSRILLDSYFSKREEFEKI